MKNEAYRTHPRGPRRRNATLEARDERRASRYKPIIDKFLSNVAAKVDTKRIVTIDDFNEDHTTCCFVRSDCTSLKDRSPEAGWVPGSDPTIEILRFPTAPFSVLAGEPDFHAQSYRRCTPQPHAVCP